MGQFSLSAGDGVGRCPSAPPSCVQAGLDSVLSPQPFSQNLSQLYPDVLNSLNQLQIALFIVCQRSDRRQSEQLPLK